MKKIKLTQGKWAMVSDRDYPSLNKHHWHLAIGTRTFYASRNYPIKKWTQGVLLMHRVITLAPKGMEVDHIDGNGLNNQRRNLRVCTKHDNQHNQRIRRVTLSGYKGVRLRPNGRCIVRIRKDNEDIYVGSFSTPKMAAREYDKAAKRLFGRFAVLNFPEKKKGKKK